MDWLILAPISGIISMIAAGYLYYWVVYRNTDTEKMREVGGAIEEGASAYLRRLYQALAGVAFIVSVILLVAVGWQNAIAYIIGSICSAIAGYLGMKVALKANSRTAYAAHSGLNKAFSVSFFAGSVMGLSMVGLALLGISIFYYIFKDPHVVLGFSLGASSLALLAKAGGGIYTKTADIGADLVGKVEMDIPEDDPRNPAVVADNVGDNVGDVAGMGADLFDSYVASVVAAMILGVALFQSDWVILPMVLSAAGIIASLLGMLLVRTREGENPGKALNRGTVFTAIFFTILSFIVVRLMNLSAGLFWATFAGMAAGVVIGFTSDYFTSTEQVAVQRTAEVSKTGSAITIITGFSYGLLSIVPSIVGICIATLASWYVAEYFGVPGVYGVSLAAVGMLALSGMVVSADAYGPIVDNAKGVAEQSSMSKEVIDIADELDAAGNTAKAITKGFAIGAAALTVLALFQAYTETAGIEGLNMLTPPVIVGIFLGAMMPPLFSALLMLSVGKNAFAMVNEVRRQFHEIPGLMAGTARPDYRACVDIAAKGALRELIVPGGLAMLSPVLVGVILGKAALGAFLGGSIFTGIIFALFMANAGGLWDNAKKLIESGAYGGKGSEAHKAAVVGDTVGDPFKDTAGPSLNTLITVMSLIATVIAPFIGQGLLG